jgi:hypothetical protein
MNEDFQGDYGSTETRMSQQVAQESQCQMTIFWGGWFRL